MFQRNVLVGVAILGLVAVFTSAHAGPQRVSVRDCRAGQGGVLDELGDLDEFGRQLCDRCPETPVIEDPCVYIESLELICDLDRSRLLATVSSDLPPCARLRLVADGAFYRDARVRGNGWARAAWRNPMPGFHEVCIDECGICATAMCGCASDAECDDGDLCTTDECIDGECISAIIECDDGEFCNGEETCDTDTGECAEGENPCSWYQECDEERDACLYGYVRRTPGCSLNGTPIDDEHYEITVAPGEQITGCVMVEATNLWPSSAVVPLVGVAQATKEAQLHDLRLARVAFREPGQGLIQCYHVHTPILGLDKQFVELHSGPPTASLLRLARLGVVDQNLTHDRSGHAEKVVPVGPAGAVLFD